MSVIGLSGMEKEKELAGVGVGKSCLCNRFIHPLEDKYYEEHISVLSQSDFAGRVINNDHFLYWGEVTKTDEGNNFTFHVVEQTEFVDDVSFTPFKTGRTDAYSKRCVQTKVQSAEKLMYICKDQLGKISHLKTKSHFSLESYVVDTCLNENITCHIKILHASPYPFIMRDNFAHFSVELYVVGICYNFLCKGILTSTYNMFFKK